MGWGFIPNPFITVFITDRVHTLSIYLTLNQKACTCTRAYQQLGRFNSGIFQPENKYGIFQPENKYGIFYARKINTVFFTPEK